MNSLYRTAALRRMEAAFAAQPLMQRAGAAAALWATDLATDPGLPVLILAGPGNNGGDAFEAARLLEEKGFNICLVFAGEPDRLPPDAAAARQRFVAAGGACLAGIPEIERWGLIMDGIFGIGLTRAPAGPYVGWINTANALARRDHCPLLSLDCPTGLDSDTGQASPSVIRATHTITFIAAKPGLYTADGPDHCGNIRVANLELSPEDLVSADGRLVSPALFGVPLPARCRNSHKGSYGNAGILGGAESMVGAVLLAGRAALKLGTGRVYLGLLAPQGPTYDPLQPELMLRPPEGVLEADLTALACGPGLGKSVQAIGILEKALAQECPLVLDADALNLLALESDLQSRLRSRQAPTVLTPHPAEAARLLACDIATIQADRIAAARNIADRLQSHVALKGCGTVIAAPDGRWWINTTGNPGLASAGTGDVLTGIVSALLAQGWDAELAILAAVYLHGAAADEAVAQGIGPIGLVASELADCARTIFNRWHSGT